MKRATATDGRALRGPTLPTGPGREPPRIRRAEETIEPEDNAQQRRRSPSQARADAALANPHRPGRKIRSDRGKARKRKN